MNAKQRGHFRKILETLKAELSQEIDRTVHTMQDEATVFADPNDRASQESDMALELRNRDRERKLIKKIDETIARIDANEYGYCDSCGVEIGLKRLEARPTATLCIDCKTLDELRERLPELPDGDVWISNSAADRFGLVSFADELPDLVEVRALIGREPEVFEEFDVE